MLDNFNDIFYLNLIKDDRWKYIVDGLAITFEVTFFSVIVGIILGFLVAIVRATHDKTGKMKALNFFCNIYENQG